MKVLTLIKAKSNVFLWYVRCCSCTRRLKTKILTTSAPPSWIQFDVFSYVRHVNNSEHACFINSKFLCFHQPRRTLLLHQCWTIWLKQCCTILLKQCWTILLKQCWTILLKQCWTILLKQCWTILLKQCWTILLVQQCCSHMITMLFKHRSGNNPI